MNKYYYCTPSKGFDTFLCGLGWFAIQMALLTAVARMVGKAVDFIFFNKKEKDSHSSPSEDEICTSCADRFKEVREIQK